MIGIDPRSQQPLYEQVVEGFRDLIGAGVMVPGEKLPSVRSLASQLAINPNTIQRAYRELELRGYTYSSPGKGSFVADAGKVADTRREELLRDFDEVAGKLLAMGVQPDELARRLEGGRQR